ncbi:hypothetical protein ACFP1I_02380 [Dyadobacter subterraneus]|uniref:Lipoprotein n=1 Tax=Dyadobacter subterraneus TaxID=2773304 RepID=A0ABR9W820_9BACT|nr:hypothetical protein [Dyadobacter subterraneus]MBE9461600.1 hypothetical protein [Dyadobacter subterraneus]
MKKVITGSLFALVLITAGCQMDLSPDNTKPIVDPPQIVVISRDSISSGNYLGLAIDEKAENVYSAVQSLQKSNGVSYLNIVSNFSTEISDLQNRLALYQYILLDESKGTDSGIQITLESGKVKSIYLNSGKELSQWPEKLSAESAVRVGDLSDKLYGKFVGIKGKSQYASKFERIMLATKDVSLAYDPLMAKSPQWYFAYSVGSDVHELVKINFQGGKVSYIIVERYK